jgi:hypothetical protein
MIFVQTLIIAFAGNLILSLVNYSECHPNCGTLARSSCTDDITTKWNKDSVGETLKKWINSIGKITSMPERETKRFFLRKTVSKYQLMNTQCKIIGDGVTLISNRNCSINKHIGPTWRKASPFSKTQFNDGLLYGIEDDNGELTGLYVIYNENVYN